MNVLVMPSLSVSGKHVHIKSPRPRSPRDRRAYTERPMCHDRDMHYSSED